MKVFCFLCHKSFLNNNDLKAHCKDDHEAQQDVDLLILLQHMTQKEKLTLRKQLEKRITTNDMREPEPSDIATKIKFWKEVQGLPVKKEEISEQNDTIDLFDEILFDNILSESVDERFNLLLESDQYVPQELTEVILVPKKKHSKKPSSSSSSKRGVQWWRFFNFNFFNFEICTTGWTF